MLDTGAGAVEHLYIHVPFCPTICPFCDFHVLERRAGLVEAYLAAIDREAAELAATYGVGALRTVYFGGGTPSYLRDAEIAALVEIVRRRLGWSTEEATLEVHPSTAGPGRVAHWAELGFDRLSVGVQSTDDATLRFLGRSHSARDALAAVHAALDHGGVRVSADLITAVPGQDVEADLERVARLGVGHVSAYTLTIEEGTPFARAGVEVDAFAEERALAAADAVLGQHGLARYEVSNHARPDERSLHNLAYWRMRRYLGLGPGATGFYPALPALGEPAPDATGVVASGIVATGAVLGWRRTNPPLGRWLAGERGEPEVVTASDYAAETMLVGLRLADGVDLTELAQRSGLDPRVHFAAALEGEIGVGRLEIEGSTVRATATGRRVLDQVASAFLAG
ncbi:MAG: coproporphyrinogen III oxidase family protein [Acidimicrobiia bacterium]|nr:coproporphyrinogen III oxidase family protein [Acidimicrobiia bacterium]